MPGTRDPRANSLGFCLRLGKWTICVFPSQQVEHLLVLATSCVPVVAGLFRCGRWRCAVFLRAFVAVPIGSSPRLRAPPPCASAVGRAARTAEVSAAWPVCSFALSGYGDGAQRIGAVRCARQQWCSSKTTRTFPCGVDWGVRPNGGTVPSCAFPNLAPFSCSCTARCLAGQNIGLSTTFGFTTTLRKTLRGGLRPGVFRVSVGRSVFAVALSPVSANVVKKASSSYP